MRTTRSWHFFNSLLGGLLLVFGLTGAAQAQQPVQLTGSVTDAAGQPIPSANIQIEGMQLGTTTNQQGRFLLVVPASRVQGQEVTVTASLIGRQSASQTATLEPGAQISLDFQLGEDPLRLQELVVTGAGTQQTREQLGISVSSVGGEEVAQQNEANLVDALSAQAPNVQVTASGGEPGAGSYIQIRGANSLLGDNQPLFVIDGVPVANTDYNGEEGANPFDDTGSTVTTNRIFDLNPSDIENIEILKGPSASAIYGSRAANGVVLITTKSGQPGGNSFSYKITAGMDEVNAHQDLQDQYGMGVSGSGLASLNSMFGIPEGFDWGCGSGFHPDDAPAGASFGFPCYYSYGAPISGQVFDHEDEVFDTGYKIDQHMTWSGGSEQTTYFLSLGRMDHESALKGPGFYDRTTVRLKGSHSFTNDLTLQGNLAYTEGGGRFVQQGSNISGLLLGAWRTPPNFNNEDYLTDAGLHRSFRLPNPTQRAVGRGYDNPYFVANEIANLQNLDRTFGNVNAEYDAFDWLNISYTLGVDYLSQRNRNVYPKGNSTQPTGQMYRAHFNRLELDHNLLANMTFDVNPDIGLDVTVGQNLNHREYDRQNTQGVGLIFGTDQLDFVQSRNPDEYRWTIRTDGYFAQASTDLYNELFLTAALRMDGASTFGTDDNRFMYPKVSGSWNFHERADQDWLSFGKLRFAYGVAGKQPPVFSNVSAFATGSLTDGWISAGGLQTIYAGNEGVLRESTLGNQNIDPERVTEFEVGTDLAFIDNRLSLGVTYYQQKTEDAILQVDVPPSTGFFDRYANAAEFSSEGWEVTADYLAVDTDNFQWTVGGNWATNQSCVEDLAGTESVFLAGFGSMSSEVVAPTDVQGEPILDADGNVVDCHQIGVLQGSDFIRFGRGETLSDGTAIDDQFPDAPQHAIYIGPDGFPRFSPRRYVAGDPNPDWTASLRSSITLFDDLSISALVDIKQGGDMWNGTKGALRFFGTHESTLPFHQEGMDGVIGTDVLSDEQVAGPGAGDTVHLDWATWSSFGLGNSFFGPGSQQVEDGGYVKLRSITVSYQVGQQDWLQTIGFNSMDVSVTGRNLKTWTDYTGIDPESNLTGQTLGRGLDYFQNPRTRSYGITLRLNR